MLQSYSIAGFKNEIGLEELNIGERIIRSDSILNLGLTQNHPALLCCLAGVNIALVL